MKIAFVPFALLFLFVIAADAAQLPSAVVTDGVALSIHNPIAATNDYARMEAMGTKVIRMPMFWEGVERAKGEYTWYTPEFPWVNYDIMVDNPTTPGVVDPVVPGTKTLFILMPDPTSQNPMSYYGTVSPTTTSWWYGFAAFAAASAKHYKGKDVIFEIWNEPNGWGFGDENYVNYMGMLNQVVSLMRHPVLGDPNCTIVATATDWITTDGWLSRFLTPCIAYGQTHPGQGLLDIVDAVSIHPYQTGPPEDWVEDCVRIRERMQTYGGKVLPILSSEWGYSRSMSPDGAYPSLGYQIQGDYAARTMLIDFSLGIPLSTWYTWNGNGPLDSAHFQTNFGIGETYDHDYNPSTPEVDMPAYQQLQLLSRSLKGTTFSQRRTDGSGMTSNDWLLEFVLPSGAKTLAAWTAGTPHYVTNPYWGSLYLTGTPFYVNPVPGKPGDANGDGYVNSLDAALLAEHWLMDGNATWGNGDFNGDEKVDDLDAAILAANWGSTPASASVPEPGAVIMLTTGLIFLFASARRKRRCECR